MKNMKRGHAAAWILLVAALLAGPLRAQTEDVFAFIPSGGKTLLNQVFQSRLPAGEVQALVTGKRSSQEWLRYLQGRGEAIPALQGLGEYELRTLANYLTFNMPLPAKKVPTDSDKVDWEKLLPPDGRDLTLDHCQFCHIITVAVTQDKTVDAWLGTMNKPSHVEIELTAEQRKALANYLVVNGAIPVDLVPEELRAGGATY